MPSTEGLVFIGVIAVLALIILVPSLRRNAQVFTASLWFRIFGQEGGVTVDRSSTRVTVKGSERVSIKNTRRDSVVQIEESKDATIIDTGKTD